MAEDRRILMKCYFTVGILRPSGIQDPLRCMYYRSGYCLSNPGDLWIHTEINYEGSTLFCYGFKDKDLPDNEMGHSTLKKCIVENCRYPRYRVFGKKPYLSSFCEEHFNEKKKVAHLKQKLAPEKKA